jgi:hypothetical protein
VYVWIVHALCMYVCMYVCMNVCMHTCMHACMFECMFICICVCTYECMNVGARVSRYAPLAAAVTNAVEVPIPLFPLSFASSSYIVIQVLDSNEERGEKEQTQTIDNPSSIVIHVSEIPMRSGEKEQTHKQRQTFAL